MEDYAKLDLTRSDWYAPLLAQTSAKDQSHLAVDDNEQVEERVHPELGQIRYALAEEDELEEGIHPAYKLAQT